MVHYFILSCCQNHGPCDVLDLQNTLLTRIGWINLFFAIFLFLILVIITILTFKKTELGDSIDDNIMESIKNVYDLQYRDFLQERDYVENLFCSRINFIILSFSLFVTAFASLDNRITQIVILLVGFIVTLPLSINTVRAYKKLDIHLKIAFNLNPDNNPMSIVDKMLKSGFHKSSKFDSYMEKNHIVVGGYNRLIGIILPKTICFLYLFGACTLGILLLLGLIN